MKICQEFHPEIAFNGGECPLCELEERFMACQEAGERQYERIQELLDERDGYRSELRL